MVPLVGTLGAVIVLTVMQIRRGKCSGSGNGQVNQSIEKDKAKVVHAFDIEDLGDKEAFCRCWRSKAVRAFCSYNNVEYHLFFW